VFNECPSTFTLSTGIIVFSTDHAGWLNNKAMQNETFEVVFKHADKAFYQGGNTDRNCIFS
tara:strand:- start:426 stop:608 length:183 start_codon:yes stop_codon:yes gene_type:complete